MNERGWVIYCDPQTRLWYTRGEAVLLAGLESCHPKMSGENENS
jgi:hypothetical protein